MEKYIGWVPCVAGKLFFKYIKCGLGSKYFGKVNINHTEADDGGSEIETDSVTGLFSYNRYVILSSRVNWKDGQEGDGNFRVVLTGQATNSGDLSGCIYVILEKDAKSSCEWKSIMNKITVLQQDLKRAAREDNDISIKDRYEEISNELAKYSHKVCHKVKYNLDRMGFVGLDYINDTKGDELQNYTVCRQAFYYLKYSLHVHQHHNKGEDSLTTIHLVPSDKHEIGEQLLDDLKESMVAMKRESAASKYQRLFDNKGVNCYARSLLESCKTKDYITDGEYKRHLSYLNNLYGSMETTAEKTQRWIDTSNAASNAARAIMLLILAILAPFTLIHLETIRNSISGESINIDGMGMVPYALMKLMSAVSNTNVGMISAVFFLGFIYWFMHANKNGSASVLLYFNLTYKLIMKIINDWHRGVIYTVCAFAISALLAWFAFSMKE